MGRQSFSVVRRKGMSTPPVKLKVGYRTFCVDFNTDEDRHYLASSVFYLFPKKIKGGQNELVKSPKMIAMTALNRVISF